MFDQTHVLIVDDDNVFLESLKLSLTDSCQIHTATTPEDGLDILTGEEVDIVITDLVLPNMNGLEFIRRAKSSNPHPEFILLTGNGSWDSAMEALRCGAFDYITKPCKIDQLLFAIQKVQRIKELERKNELLREQLTGEQGTEEKRFILTCSSCSIRDMERQLIEKVLHQQNGNIKRSAELLGITRATLYNKLGKYQIDRRPLI